MSSSGNDWRSSPAYDYFDDLTPEQTAFEFLRRDEAYAVQYGVLAKAPGQAVQETVDSLVAPWGLRFRGRSAPPRRPGPDYLAAAL